MFGWLKSKNKKADLPKSAIVQPIVVKTQAEQDIELMASTEWQNQLLEAKKIWNIKFSELDEVIIDLQKSEMKMILFNCALYFNLNVELDDNLLADSFRYNLRKKIEEILSIEVYKEYMIKKTTKYFATYIRPVEYYVSEFEILRNKYLYGVINLFKNYLINSETVLNDIHELNRMHKNLKPESNNQGRIEWLRYMSAYASKNLKGLSSDNFYPMENPLCNLKYFQYNTSEHLLDAAKLFAMRLHATMAFFEKREQSSTTSVGIEFENNLREVLLAEISDVVVETTPVTGDHGADLLIRVGSVRIAIQAKRYAGVVGNAAVQEIFAAKQFYDADFAMVVTTSHYTNPAKVLAEKLEVTLATESDFIQKIRRLLN